MTRISHSKYEVISSRVMKAGSTFELEDQNMLKVQIYSLYNESCRATLVKKKSYECRKVFIYKYRYVRILGVKKCNVFSNKIMKPFLDRL